MAEAFCGGQTTASLTSQARELRTQKQGGCCSDEKDDAEDVFPLYQAEIEAAKESSGLAADPNGELRSDTAAIEVQLSNDVGEIQEDKMTTTITTTARIAIPTTTTTTTTMNDSASSGIQIKKCISGEKGKSAVRKRVRWSSNVRQTRNTCLARGCALARLSYIRVCLAEKRLDDLKLISLPRTNSAVALCLEWAALLPASNLRTLQGLCYALPASRWKWNEYPVAFDARGVIEKLVAINPRYRWWHVQLNFALSYSTGVRLNECVQCLIKSQTGGRLASALYEPASGWPPPVFIPLFFPDVDPKNEDNLYLAMHDIIDKGADGADSTSTRETVAAATPRQKAKVIPVFQIDTMDQWFKFLKALGSSNLDNKALSRLL